MRRVSDATRSRRSSGCSTISPRPEASPSTPPIPRQRSSPSSNRAFLEAVNLRQRSFAISRNGSSPYRPISNIPGILPTFPNSTGVVGVVADLLASTLNQNVSLVRGGPSAAAIERQVVSWLASLIDYPGGGVLTSGGSMANLMALGLARELLGSGPDSVFYLSVETHSSMDRALRFLGFRGDSVRHVEVDEHYRMDPDALRERDPSGPILGRQADLRRGDRGQHRIRCHRSSRLSRRGLPNRRRLASCRRRLRGAGGGGPIPRVASCRARRRRLLVDGPTQVAIRPDRHQLSAREGRRRRCDDFFTIVPEYLKVTGNEDVYQPMEHTLELSRRLRGLRLWMVLKCYGAEAIRARIEEHVLLARRLAEWIDESEHFELCAPAATSTVCFRYLPPTAGGESLTPERLDEINETIFHEINRRPDIYVSRNRLGGRFTLRACITHLRTTQDDVVRLWSYCQEIAAELFPGQRP